MKRLIFFLFLLPSVVFSQNNKKLNDSDLVVVKTFENMEFVYYVCERSYPIEDTLNMKVLKTYFGDNVEEEAVKKIFLGDKIVYGDTIGGSYYENVSLFIRVKKTDIEKVYIEKKTQKIRYEIISKSSKQQTLNGLGWATAGAALVAVVVTVVIVLENIR